MKVLKAIVATAMWIWLVSLSIDSVVYTLLLFPWMLLLVWWPVLLVLGVLYFWAVCWTAVQRLDEQPATWAELLLLLPWVALTLPVVVHVVTFYMMVSAWYSASPSRQAPAD